MYFIDIKAEIFETNNLEKLLKFPNLLFYTLQYIIILHFCFNNKYVISNKKLKNI